MTKTQDLELCGLKMNAWDTRLHIEQIAESVELLNAEYLIMRDETVADALIDLLHFYYNTKRKYGKAEL